MAESAVTIDSATPRGFQASYPLLRPQTPCAVRIDRLAKDNRCVGFKKTSRTRTDLLAGSCLRRRVPSAANSAVAVQREPPALRSCSRLLFAVCLFRAVCRSEHVRVEGAAEEVGQSDRQARPAAAEDRDSGVESALHSRAAFAAQCRACSCRATWSDSSCATRT